MQATALPPPFHTASLLLLLSLISSPILAAPATHPGAAIYQQHCVKCHGEKGEGVKDVYEEPLHGNRTVAALAKRIHRTMPEDNPDLCVGEDAKLVAQYIYEAFYSPAAQQRLRPPEEDLSRLTVEQYRNTVADLVGKFRPDFYTPASAEHGLKAFYRSKQKYTKIDPQIHFDFNGPSTDPERFNPSGANWFSIHWEGSLLVNESGVYEFALRTENSATLFLNNSEKAFIDCWLNKSPDGKVFEEKASLFLIAGQRYPIRLQYFKSREATSSISLCWKPPHGVMEPIPSHHLSPFGAPEVSDFAPKGHENETEVKAPTALAGPEVLVINTPFPPDDRSVGYERGSAVSKEWDQATTDAAIEAAEYIETHLESLAQTKASASDHAEKIKTFALNFAQTAFRRPLDDFNRAFIEKQFEASATPELAAKRSILYILKSIRFLYPEFRRQTQPVDNHDVASRLALALWDSLPDPELTSAAASGQLQTQEQITAQARRMLNNPRTKAKLFGFFHHWLELERAANISKDTRAFPEFNEAVLADLRTSLDLFIDQVVWSDRSDYRELLQADYLFLNHRLAKIYGRGDLPGEDFQRVAYAPQERAGVITHPYLLASFAYSKTTSPIHRGVFLSRNIVGMTLNSPPVAVAFEDSHFDPSFTMREKVTELTKNVNCMGCHSTINPLGFGLENYDAIGRWQTHDNNKPVNTKGDLPTEDGHNITLTGARDIVNFVAQSRSSHRSFIHQLFNHTIKQPVAAYGPDALEQLRQSFTDSGFNIQQLLVDIVVLAATKDFNAHQKSQDVAAQHPQKTES